MHTFDAFAFTLRQAGLGTDRATLLLMLEAVLERRLNADEARQFCEAMRLSGTLSRQ